MNEQPEIFHMCTNYPSSTVHRSLISFFWKRGVRSQVFVPIRSAADRNKNFLDLNGVAFWFIGIPNRLLRFFPLAKIFYVFIRVLLVLRNNRLRPQIFIAHSFWSDGMICLLLKFFFGINYVVCVRNTDLNLFLKYLIWYKPLQKIVCDNAEKIVFISPALKAKALKGFPYVFGCDLERFEVIPNAISSDYLEDLSLIRRQKSARDNLRCCFVGKDVTNKNLRGVVTAIKSLEDKFVSINLAIVGLTARQISDAGIQIEKWMQIHSLTHDVDLLKRIYRGCDILVMPSYAETFGLVYLEAISQGCSCVCSDGEGISGLFNGMNLVYLVDPNDAKSIADGILRAKLDFNEKNDNFDILKRALINDYSWDGITEMYLKLIRPVVKF